MCDNFLIYLFVSLCVVHTLNDNNAFIHFVFAFNDSFELHIAAYAIPLIYRRDELAIDMC